ncbi:uncharacterized protein LOC132760355 isoform X2 [Ruditapes philippinarum]|uniref:uncharacterized protein LOC132760355 isoform X2 n=1 Tax=Ruditapes philippinarum TaxID=129788 RepID=UPI00295A9438|nr:uncharacterized protein LOC132760355 isoform X2 [Ruditapes philippinarum]
MDDTQNDGSDSDWDSTLDFTSQRHPGIGQLKPGINLEIEEESALSDESDLDVEDNLPNDKQVIKNDLKPVEERPRAPSPNISSHSNRGNQKENNIVLAQKQQQKQSQQAHRTEQPANQHAQKTDIPDPPPYNFRDAITDSRQTPEPAERGPPGKDKKGTAYDPAPSPTPRGIQKQQGSIRSIGSWDDSDPDERTLREIRTNYRQEKQREELKVKEETSIVEDPPQTARSETTWRSWKFGKKNKGPKNNTQSQASVVQATPRLRDAPQQSARSQTRTVQGVNVSHRGEVTSPAMVEVFDQRYSTSPPMPQIQYVQYPAPAVAPPPVQKEEELLEDPPRLFMKDEDTGRYVYYFGHGNLRYYEVNEEYDEAKLPPIADKVDRIVQRVWQEVFAVLRIVLSILIWFCVELFRFLAKHIFQPLIVGVFVTLGDFVIKPFLSAMFNGFVQPGSIFFWNVFTGMRHMFSPVGDILRKVLEQFAMLFRSVRLFDITWVSGRENTHHLQPHVIQTV